MLWLRVHSQLFELGISWQVYMIELEIRAALYDHLNRSQLSIKAFFSQSKQSIDQSNQKALKKDLLKTLKAGPD